MKLQNIPFWMKYRPNSIDKVSGKIPIILYPRIKKILEKELSMNFIFYGPGGVGKSCLSGIITQDTDCLKIDSSKDNGIDVVREQLHNHCTKYSILGGNKQKTVWLDEFDGTTTQMRDALRGFIENHSHVRFIATVNNLNKINRSEQEKALISRFNLINCDALDSDEQKWMMNSQIAFLKGICKKESSIVEDDILEKLVKNNFPNFRISIQHLQELILLGGDYESFKEIVNERNSEIFSFLFTEKNDIFDNYNFVLDNYKDKTDDLLKTLSRPLFVYLMSNKSELLSLKGSSLIKLSKEYNAEYFNTMDPEVHLISYITELKKLLNK